MYITYMIYGTGTYFQELNVTVLCLAITDVADQRCSSLLDNATATATKFKKVLTLFAKCHTVYSGQSFLSDNDLKDLGNKKLHIS